MANWALVVGINSYQRLRSLRYAERDAQLMRDYFENEAGFEQVFYFADNSEAIEAPDGSLQETRPIYANLISFLHDFFEYDEERENPPLAAGDNLWFFFSGHGLRYLGEDYLVPSNGNPRLVRETNIALSYVTQRLRRSGADNVMLLLDACRNENELGSKGAGIEKQQGVITIASCSPQQESYEIEEIRQGSFTYALLEALRIQGEGNCATVERLYQHLRHRVAEINASYQKPVQTPYAIVEPASKYHLILLPDYATLTDIATLKIDAFQAEAEGDWELAQQLWVRVNVAARGSDLQVIKAFSRIARQQGQSTSPRQENVVSIPETVRGERSVASEPSPVIRANTELNVFSFDVLIVDTRGQEIRLEEGQAQYFREDLGNGVTLDMVSIPGGSFMMGSPKGEGYGYEKPQHEVTVQPFFMGRFQITQAQWKAIANTNPSHFKGDDLPVERVSWDDAAEFCQRLSLQTGKEYRLPTEAEWEYACRAGTTTPFHFGETITGKLANYRASETYANEPTGEYREETTSVGSFSPNTFGLYDMHGNVWEWCADDWHNNYQGAPNDISAWRSGSGKMKVLRSGSWLDYPGICRSAYRYNLRRDFRSFDIGFRVVCVALKTI